MFEPVDTSTTRPHERRTGSPASAQPVFAENQSFPFSQAESRTRSSFVAIVPPVENGWRALGGSVSGAIPTVATCCTRTAAGGMPSTLRMCATRELGSSTETTYSVGVGDSDCTGAREVSAGSGPYVVEATVGAPSTASCLLRIQSSPPTTGEKLSLQFANTSAARTTIPSATPSRGWSGQPLAANAYTLQAADGSPVCDTAGFARHMEEFYNRIRR